MNITHLELFHHFGEIISPLFVGRDPDLCREYVQNYHKAAFTGIYLMYEILAFAARHLSITGPPTKSQFYADQATMLQTRALSLFSASLQEPQPDTIISTFLFSSLLGTHLLSDTIASQHMELDPFLSRFVDYLKVSFMQALRCVELILYCQRFIVACGLFSTSSGLSCSAPSYDHFLYGVGTSAIQKGLVQSVSPLER